MKVATKLKRGRGRPALEDGQVVMVRLPAAMIADIDAAAGPGQRSAFIRDAIKREIARRAHKVPKR